MPFLGKETDVNTRGPGDPYGTTKGLKVSGGLHRKQPKQVSVAKPWDLKDSPHSGSLYCLGSTADRKEESRPRVKKKRGNLPMSAPYP